MANHRLEQVDALMQGVSHRRKIQGSYRPDPFRLSVIAASIALCSNVHAQTGIPGLNTTQTDMANAIEVLCPLGDSNNASDFQARCDALLRATDASAQVNAVQRVAPEQIISQGTQATKTSFNIFGARLTALRLGARGIRIAGLESDPASGSAVAGLSPSFQRGGAAGDGSSALLGRFGAFVNGVYNFGDVDTTFDQVGFDYDGGGVTAGADYRFTDDLIAGVGFSYIHSAADFDRDGGDLDSDSYNGLVYGTYYLPNGVYVDGIATFGGINYDSTRNIRYRLPTEATGGVNTQATADSDGWQYSFDGGAGYNYAVGEWTLNPYLRGSYINLDVDGFTETGGSGWAMIFEDQEVESVTTTLGTQLSYSMSTPDGVFLPYIRGEWHHEFEDDSRDIIVRFAGDLRRRLPFTTATADPDRNYFTVGAGISGTLAQAQGISAFFNYDALLGYDDVDSHVFTVGARMEF